MSWALAGVPYWLQTVGTACCKYRRFGPKYLVLVQRTVTLRLRTDAMIERGTKMQLNKLEFLCASIVTVGLFICTAARVLHVDVALTVLIAYCLCFIIVDIVNAVEHVVSAILALCNTDTHT